MRSMEARLRKSGGDHWCWRDLGGFLCGRGPKPRKPPACQQLCLTAVQQLVLHTVALQRLLTLWLLPAHFQRRGSQS